MRTSRPLIGRILSAGAILALVTTAGLVTTPSPVAALPPQKPCGETACLHTAHKEWFAFGISRSRWSIAAVQGIPGGTDLNLWDSSTVPLKSSHSNDATTWIAMDNTPGRQPTGAHSLSVDLTLPPNAPAEHWIQFINGHGDLLQQHASTIGDPNGTWLADIRDVRLQAGEMLGLSTHGDQIGEIRVLSSDPARPSSWLQTQDAIPATTFYVPKADTPDEVHNFTFTAPDTGTYGLVFLPYGWWSRSSTVNAGIVG